MTNPHDCNYVPNCSNSAEFTLVTQEIGGLIGKICAEHAEELERRFEQFAKSRNLYEETP